MSDDPEASEPDETEGPPAPASITPPAPKGIVLTVEMVVGFLAAGLVIFGSFGSWVSIGPIDVSGIKGDGVITLIAGIVAVLVIAVGRWHLAALVAGLAASCTAIYDLARIGDVDESFLSVSPGWGILAVLVGAVGLVAWALFELSRRQDKRVAYAGGALATALLGVVVVLALTGTFGERAATSKDLADADVEAPAADPTPTASGSEEPDAAAPSTPTSQIGGQIHLDGANGLKMVATVERVIDPAYGGEFDQPSEGKRFVAVMLRLTNVGDVPYDDSPSNGATLTYGDDQEASTSTLSGGQCSSGFASSAKISPGSRRKGCIVFEVPSSNTIKTFQLALDSGFADQAGEWNVRPANRTAATRSSSSAQTAETSDAFDAPLTACDQNISRGSGTTCDYANDIFRRYAARLDDGAGPDMAVGAAYCSYDGSDVSCSGDDGEFVTFPKWAADVY